MKTGIMNVLLTASIALTSLGFAQTLQHDSSVAAPTYLGLGYTYLGLDYVQGTLQVSTNSTAAVDLSPKVQTIAFKEGQLSTGFEALHADTTLSEVVSYYWDALSGLGFTGSVQEESRRVVTYSFSNGNNVLEAVFTQDEGEVLADFFWTGTELASTGN